MSCEFCGGSGWQDVQWKGGSALKACPCRVRAVPAEPQTPLTLDGAAEGVAILFELLDWPPTSDTARAIFIDALHSMVETREQLAWVLSQVPQYHTKWSTCGLSGLRQILSLRYRPKDGWSLSVTDTYPDGLPARPLPAPEFPTLPPGRLATLDSSLDTSVSTLAEAKAIRQTSDGLSPAVKNRRPIPELRPDPNTRKITQADVDWELEKLRAAKTEEES